MQPQLGIFNNLAAIPNLLAGIGGAATAIRGAQMQAQGASQAAASYRMAANESLAAANYNVQLEKLNLLRTLDSSSRDIRTLMSQTAVQKATSGFSSSSKSFLQVTNATMSALERQIVDLRATSKQRAESILFEGRAAAVRFENLARASSV